MHKERLIEETFHRSITIDYLGIRFLDIEETVVIKFKKLLKNTITSIVSEESRYETEKQEESVTRAYVNILREGDVQNRLLFGMPKLDKGAVRYLVGYAVEVMLGLSEYASPRRDVLYLPASRAGLLLL